MLSILIVIIAAFSFHGCATPTNILEPSVPAGSMLWVSIQDQGSGAAIINASSAAITVETPKPGNYIVTLPEGSYAGCTATLNNSVGFVTCVPGGQAELSPNQVQVMTLNPDNTFGPRDFTLTVYPKNE